MNTNTSKFLNDFWNLFRGRIDRIGTMCRKSIRISNPNLIPSKFLSAHLMGRERIGFYNLLSDSTVRWSVVEFESHGGRSVKEPWNSAKQFVEKLFEVGIHAYIERSKSGGQNFHCWSFWERPESALKVRRTNLAILEKMNLVKQGRPQVEIFPCRDQAANSLGTFVWLPFFGGIDSHKGKPGYGIKQECTVFLNAIGKAIPPQQFLTDAKKNSQETLPCALLKLGSAPQESPLQFIQPSQDRKKIWVPKIASEKELLKPILENCPRVAGIIEEQKRLSKDQTIPAHKRGVSYDEWFYLIGVFCHFEVGPKLIHRISALSPKYDTNTTQTAINKWRKDFPPTTCERLGCDIGCFSKPSPVRWVYRSTKKANRERKWNSPNT